MIKILRKLTGYILPALLIVAMALPLTAIPVFAATNTLAFYTTSSDGYITKADAVYATAQGAATGTQFTGSQATLGQTTGFNIYRSFLYIPTENIPDTATITGATLYIYGAANYTTTDFDIVVQNGMPTFPSDPLVTGDYDITQYAGDGGSLNTSTWSTTGYNAIVLDATGYGWINKTGDTKFALISQEDISVSEPTDNEYVTFYLNDQTGTDKDPYLSVTYTFTGTPELVTKNATSITDFTAVLNGLITGADTLTRRGFDWGTTTAYGFEWFEDGSYDVGTFSRSIGGLSPGITYHFRAKAYNATYGWGYGADTTFIKQGTGAIVGSTTASIPVGYYGFLHNTFFANGRHWAFYTDGTNIVSKNSPDGVSWSDTTVVRAATTFASFQFDVWFDGTYFHYSFGKADTANHAIYYRRGIPNSDGTITWSAVEQVAVAADASYQFDNANITVDSNGFAWIGYVRHPAAGAGANSRPFITKSTATNGTWATAATYPFMLEDVQIVQYSRAIPLTNGKVYVVYSGCGKIVQGRLWDGSSWGGIESVSTSLNDDYQVSAVAYNDDIHVVFVKVAPKAPIHVKRTFGIGWGAETNLGGSIISEFPEICANWNGDVYVMWAMQPTAYHIYYLKYTNATDSWDTTVVVPNDWVTETAMYSAQYSTSPNAPDGKIGFLYRQGTLATHYVKYVYLNAPPSISVTTSTATGITEIAATLQGTLVDDGGQTCSVRFQWGSSPTMANDTIWQGNKTSDDVFSQGITGLTVGTTYYFRAQAKWADGTTGNGNMLTFNSLGATAPEISTGSATGVGETSATLQGTLTSLGSYSPVYVYFQYGLTTSYGSTTVEQTKTSTGGYNQALTGLTTNTTYHYRAVIRYNGTNYIYGSDDTFATTTTGLLPPTSFTATRGDTTVALSWVKASGATDTMVRRSTTGFPTTTSSGVLVYNGTGTSNTDTGLTNSQAYYYSAWSEGSVTGVYSVTYATVYSPPAGTGAGVLPPPDYIWICNVVVFESYQTPGDQLIVFEYRLDFATTPTQPARDFFAFEVWDGATLVARSPVMDWGTRPGSVYLSPSSALIWGQTFTLKLVGLASQWASPVPSDSQAVNSFDWTNYREDFSVPLRSWCLMIAGIINPTWVVPTPTGEVLSDEAGIIFNRAIPALSSRIPDLFATSSGFIDIEPRAHTDDYQQTLTEDNLGTDVTDLLDEGAGLFGMPDGVGFGSMLIIFLAVAGAVLVGFFTRSVGFSLAVATVVMGFGVWGGLVALAWVMVVGGILAMYMLFVFFARGV